MENIQKDESLTPEAIEAEKEQLKEIPETEVRESLIEKYGLDELEQSDLIDSLVQEAIENKKKLSTAIGQKIDWRTKAQALSEKKSEEKPQPVQQPGFLNEDSILQKVDERLNQKELESLELDESLQKEVKNYALLNKVSYKEALKSPYIQFQKKEMEEKQRIEEASIGSKHRTMANKNFSDVSPADFDMATEEGRKGFAEYKQWLKTQ